MDRIIKKLKTLLLEELADMHLGHTPSQKRIRDIKDTCHIIQYIRLTPNDKDILKAFRYMKLPKRRIFKPASSVAWAGEWVPNRYYYCNGYVRDMVTKDGNTYLCNINHISNDSNYSYGNLDPTLGDCIATGTDQMANKFASMTFESLPDPSVQNLGYMYNITNDFVTDTRFLEGENKACAAGTTIMVVYVNGNYCFDIPGSGGGEDSITSGDFDGHIGD